MRAQYWPPMYLIPIHTWPCPLWCVVVTQRVCVCVCEHQCGSHSPVCSSRPAVFPLLLQRITAVERASLSPQGWNACPAPRLWETLSQKSTEPLSNGIPHSQSPTPTGLLKVEVTRDSYPHCCMEPLYGGWKANQPEQVLVVGPLITGRILFPYLSWQSLFFLSIFLLNFSLLQVKDVYTVWFMKIKSKTNK